MWRIAAREVAAEANGCARPMPWRVAASLFGERQILGGEADGRDVDVAALGAATLLDESVLLEGELPRDALREHVVPARCADMLADLAFVRRVTRCLMRLGHFACLLGHWSVT